MSAARGRGIPRADTLFISMGRVSSNGQIQFSSRACQPSLMILSTFLRAARKSHESLQTLQFLSPFSRILRVEELHPVGIENFRFFQLPCYFIAFERRCRYLGKWKLRTLFFRCLSNFCCENLEKGKYTLMRRK